MASARSLGGETRIVVASVMVVLVVAASGALAQAQKRERKIAASGAVAELDDANHTVLLSGGAKLSTDEGTITSREISARLDERNSVQTAQAQGEVRLNFHYTTKEGVERQMQGSAERAIYDATDRTVQLLGHVVAELREPATQRTVNIAAEEVTLWIDQSRLRIRPAELVFTEVVEQEPKPAPAAQK
jgi:lipopolysaccharide export system protein LptA